MRTEKKKFRELSDEDLKNVTGGYLVYVEPYEDDLVVVDPYEPIIVVDPIYYKSGNNSACNSGYVQSKDSNGSYVCQPVGAVGTGN